jgi:6-phosphogluconolactonase
VDLRPRWILVTAAALISLVGCSSGNSGSSGGSNPNPVPNPVPSITSITPSSANAGGAGVTIMVNGEGFISSSTVNWNGSSRATTVSGTQLTAAITAADIATMGAAQITVVNPAPGGGTSNPASFAINGQVAAAVPGFLYVANLPTAIILAFAIDPNTGTLTPVAGSHFQTVLGGASMTTDPTGKYLYVADGNVVSALAIDPSTGALSPILGSPFSTGALVDALSISVDFTGKFLYTADFAGDGTNSNDPNSISEFAIDSTTGALTLIPQAAACVPATPPILGLATAVVADPASGLLFATNENGLVCSFSMNTQGELQPVAGSPFSLGANAAKLDPRGVAVDPFGKFLYTSDFGSFPQANVSAFSITPGIGSLTPVSGSPFNSGESAGDVPEAVAVDPLGRFLYVTNIGDISGYSINQSTGALSMLAGFPFESVIPLSPLALDPSGKFLYVVTQNAVPSAEASLSGFAIDATTGALSPVPGLPLPIPGQEGILAVSRKAQ